MYKMLPGVNRLTLLRRPEYVQQPIIDLLVLVFICGALIIFSEPYLDKQILHASFALAKHTVVPMDLVAVETCTGKKMFSFLATAWGIISDVDIENDSEVWETLVSHWVPSSE
jgi:hypothetical protein